ncbi:MAG: hypothetical protein JSS34_05405 [Proteobacteria bacterium]|nr:hypothetical protein [Pseudomonadota bacterium]
MQSKQFDVIGYRANSGKRGWGRCDGEKRAIVVISSQQLATINPDHEFEYVSCVYGGNINHASSFITPRNCMDYEVGLAAGLSGGGVFVDETSFVGLSTRHYYNNPSILDRMRSFLFNNFKVVASFGVPAPFVGQPKGSCSGLLPLVYFKGWIEEHQKIENANALEVVSIEDRTVTFLSFITDMPRTRKYAQYVFKAPEF